MMFEWAELIANIFELIQIFAAQARDILMVEVAQPKWMDLHYIV